MFLTRPPPFLAVSNRRPSYRRKTKTPSRAHTKTKTHGRYVDRPGTVGDLVLNILSRRHRLPHKLAIFLLRGRLLTATPPPAAAAATATAVVGSAVAVAVGVGGTGGVLSFARLFRL